MFPTFFGFKASMKLRLARKMVLLIEPDPKIFNRITEALVGVGVTLCVIVPSAAEASDEAEAHHPRLGVLERRPARRNLRRRCPLAGRAKHSVRLYFSWLCVRGAWRARLSLDLPIDAKGGHRRCGAACWRAHPAKAPAHKPRMNQSCDDATALLRRLAAAGFGTPQRLHPLVAATARAIAEIPAGVLLVEILMIGFGL